MRIFEFSAEKVEMVDWLAWRSLAANQFPR
jgi:hypothetical protein